MAKTVYSEKYARKVARELSPAMREWLLTGGRPYRYSDEERTENRLKTLELWYNGGITAFGELVRKILQEAGPTDAEQTEQ